MKEERFTLKDDEYWVKSDNQYKANQKLGQLEDIEEELGFSLIDLFTKKSVFAKNQEGEIYEYEFGSVTNIEKTEHPDGRGGTYFRHDSYTDETYLDLKEKCIRITSIWDNDVMGSEEHYFKNYGKTWALTREELK